jgi:hypothetical protein
MAVEVDTKLADMIGMVKLLPTDVQLEYANLQLVITMIKFQPGMQDYPERP